MKKRIVLTLTDYDYEQIDKIAKVYNKLLKKESIDVKELIKIWVDTKIYEESKLYLNKN